jgi:hypothetical protein
MRFAISTENEGLCRYLIANGADVGERALNKAVEKSLVSMARLMVDHGAIVTTELVKRAKKLGSSEMITLLQGVFTRPRQEEWTKRPPKTDVLLSGSLGKSWRTHLCLCFFIVTGGTHRSVYTVIGM